MQQNGDFKAHRDNTDTFTTVSPDASQLPSQPDETLRAARVCEKQLHEAGSKAETSGRFKPRGGGHDVSIGGLFAEA